MFSEFGPELQSQFEKTKTMENFQYGWILICLIGVSFLRLLIMFSAEKSFLSLVLYYFLALLSNVSGVSTEWTWPFQSLRKPVVNQENLFFFRFKNCSISIVNCSYISYTISNFFRKRNFLLKNNWHKKIIISSYPL